MSKSMKNNWQTKKLGEVCDIFNGNSINAKIKKKKYFGLTTGFPFIATKDVSFNSSIDYENGVKIPNNETVFKISKKDSVLICAEGGSAGRKIGFTEQNVCFGNKLFSIYANKHSNKFIYYFCFTNYFQKEFKKSLTGIIGGVSLKKFKEIQIPLPPLPEQKRIVKILDEVFKKTGKAKENAERNLKNAKDLFESYLQNVFVNTGKDWEEKKLDEICEMINRGVSPKYTESNGLCVLNQKCIRDHKVNFDLARLHDVKNKKVSSEKYIKIGDVLINSTGTGTLGRVAQVRELNIEATVDSHVTIVRSIKNLFYNKFFGYGLIFIEKEITKRGDGCGGQTELARNTLKNDFRICYPKSLSEQKSIVAKLDALSAETKKLESIYKQKLSDLEELKKSVLKKAFEGKL